MAGVSQDKLHLGTEEANTEVLKALESDSDSGQGSCEITSPGDLSRRMESLEDGDSDEEICVGKKSKNKKILEESDCEAEGEVSTVTVGAEVNMGSEDEIKENTLTPRGKPRRIRYALLDSDESEAEETLNKDDMERITRPSSDQDKPELDSQKDHPVIKEKKAHKSSKKQAGSNDEKVKSKSKRRMEKEEKKMRAVKKLKDKKQKSKAHEEEEEEKRPPLNDSGCLLADGDLFETEVGEESDASEVEESLDAIRANVKEKLKKHSLKSEDDEGAEYQHEFEEREDKGEKRKERKAARISKEAMKQLHSETQRLIRASSVSLPYHLPEPKTIHDFYKRRPRPACQGSAMQLIKSTKYQPCNTEEIMDTRDTHCTENQTCDSAPTESNIDQELPLQGPEGSQSAVHGDVLKEAHANGESEYTHTIDGPEMTASPFPCKESLGQEDSDQRGEEYARNTISAILDTQPERVFSEQHCDESQTSAQTSAFTVSTQHKAKQSKLEKLRALGVDLSLKPRLCPDDGSFINFDEPEPNKELEALKERFLKHTRHKAKFTGERKVNLNIVRKETTAEGNEELKLDVVPVTVAAEKLEGKVHDKPGEKLQVLKAKLQAAMKVRRTEERHKRQALFKLDNEDGFEDEEEEEEEEEEMTDESEEEGDAETVEYLLGEEDDNEEDTEDKAADEELGQNKTEVTIPVPTPVATESSLMLFKDNSTKMGDFLADKIENDRGACKRDCKLEDDDSLPQLTKENSHNSSFELVGSMIPSYQPCNKTARGAIHCSMGGFRSPSPGLFRASFLSSASKSSGKMSEPSLPVEDSQDLYNASPEPKNSYLCSGDSRFRFSLEDDTQSQLLDADGFLNVGHHRSKYNSAKHRLALDTMDENAMDTNMDELLDLCSGQFKACLSNGTQAAGAKKEDMEELLGLCSGKFVSQADCSTLDSSASSKHHRETDKNDPMAEALALCSGSFPTDREDEEEEEEEEEFGDFQLLPDDGSDSEEEEERERGENEEKEASVDEDDEEEILRQRQGKKRKLKLQDFMEDEAELSGSDLGSGDEDEGDEDEYEEDAIDEELPSNEELQDQVNKIHMKVTMDEDQRQLRLYQERYLADGDLHSDGPGRMRKFRWKNLDDASQLDMFRRDSDMEEQEAENEDLGETEVKWRKERFEREQWQREQSQSGHVDKEEEEEIGEGSEFMKLARKVTAKVLQRRVTTETKEPKKPSPRNPFEVMRPFGFPKMITGSLLNKPKEVLQKLAAMSDLNPNAPRNSRNFVFQTLSPGKKAESAGKPKSQIKKNISAAIAGPSPKRPRVEKASAVKSKSRSVFPFLEN
ncbi:claspin isoform X2 [Ascaphus truei]|uniref:claspin isoform X2 n=1 Tax=Ascaphus truei TaxID=8439 RepID=UPI003F59CF19